MRNFCIVLIAVGALCFASPVVANDVGNHCQQFASGHPGCGGGDGGDGDGGGGPGGQGVPGGGVFTNTNTNTARSNATAFSGVDFGQSEFGNSTNDLSVSGQQGQKQKQAQDQANAQNTNIDASDRSVQNIEAEDIPVASAAPVFASACSAGVSAQTMGFGGSLATTNPMCDMALAAEMARSVGNDELAYELTMEAATFARARTNVVRRFGQWIPFIGSLW